jgi:hypothetical protein
MKIIIVIEKKATRIMIAFAINTQNIFFSALPFRKKSKYTKLNESMAISVTGNPPKGINMGNEMKIIAPAIKENEGKNLNSPIAQYCPPSFAIEIV